MRSVASVCVYVCIIVYMYIYLYICIYIYVCQQKNWLFSTLPLENLLLSVISAFSLSLNASVVVCYVQSAVRKEQFMLFQIRRGGPLGPEILYYGTRGHSLARGCVQCLRVCAQILLCQKERESLLGRLLKTWKQRTSLGKTVLTDYKFYYKFIVIVMPSMTL